jgi:hypothetical protein
MPNFFLPFYTYIFLNVGIGLNDPNWVGMFIGWFSKNLVFIIDEKYT